jgi:integral membrane sensor domain MASE1
VRFGTAEGRRTMSMTGMPRFRKIWSRVQVGLLGAVVLFCIVMLLLGGGTLRPVYAVAAIFFGIALAGHATYLWWTARWERQQQR